MLLVDFRLLVDDDQCIIVYSLMVDRVSTIGNCYMMLCNVASEEGGRKGEKKHCMLVLFVCVCLNDGVLSVGMELGEVIMATCSAAV